MKKNRFKKKIDFETVKKQMLLYKQLGHNTDDALSKLNESLRKDANLCQSSQQERPT